MERDREKSKEATVMSGQLGSYCCHPLPLPPRDLIYSGALLGRLTFHSSPLPACSLTLFLKDLWRILKSHNNVYKHTHRVK